jgi:hypothetical protein
MASTFAKDPDSLLDYLVDWSAWVPVGDVIVDAFTSADPGIVVSHQTYTSTGHTIWLSGGEVNRVYRITSKVRTGGGRADDRSFHIKCVQR